MTSLSRGGTTRDPAKANEAERLARCGEPRWPLLIVVLLGLILAAVMWGASEQSLTACVTKAAEANTRDRDDVLGLGASDRQSDQRLLAAGG